MGLDYAYVVAERAFRMLCRDIEGCIADMKAAVEKIHKAGYRAGLHTLTGCIDPKDPWVAGEENGELLDWESYTLAEDLTSEATELTVCEPPKFRHDSGMIPYLLIQATATPFESGMKLSSIPHTRQHLPIVIAA